MTARAFEGVSAGGRLWALITLAVALGCSSAASAGEYHVASCNKRAGADGLGQANWTFQSSLWLADTDDIGCPEGLALATGRELFQGDRLQWRFSLELPELSISRVSFSSRLERSATGFRYEIAACDNCASLTEIPSAASVATDSNLTVFLDGAPELVVRGKCVESTCPPTPGLLIHDFDFTLKDDTPPSLTLRSPDYDTDNPWVGRTGLRLNIATMDHGSGVLGGSLQLDGGQIGQFAEDALQRLGCASSGLPFYEMIRPCPQYPALSSLYLQPREPDGPHLVKATASDLTGNTVEQSFAYRSDATPPGAPSNLRANGVNNFGWYPDTSIALSWAFEGEVSETEFQSGLAKIFFILRNQDASLASAAPSPVAPVTAKSKIISIPSDGYWSFDLWGVDAAGNVGPSKQVEFGVDTTTPDPPDLAANGWLSREQLIRGYSQRWGRPSNIAELESGICGYSIGVYNDTHSVPPPAITAYGDVTSARLWPDAVEGADNWVRLRAISCSGRISQVASARLPVDGSPPATRIAAPASGQWSSSPVTFSIAAEDQHSGVASIMYAVNGAPAITTPDKAITSTLGEGSNRLVYSATDAVGNTSPEESLTVNIDSTPPDGRLEPHDPTNPALVSARVVDRLSGIASAALEYRRDAGADEGETRWNTLDSKTGRNTNSGEFLLSAQVQDDELPAGLYEFRIVATDRAGNRLLSTATGGGSLRISLPARKGTFTSAQVAPAIKRCDGESSRCSSALKCKAGFKCQFRVTADRVHALDTRISDYAQPVALIGESADADGTPLSGRLIEIFARPKGGSAARVGYVTTSADGTYTFWIKPGPTRTYTVRFVGDTLLSPSRGVATLHVRARPSIRASLSRVRSGSTVKFSGTLASGSDGIPEGGKSYLLQYWNGSRWSTVDYGLFGGDGRYVISYPFSRPVERPVRLAFRLLVPGESAWQFATGVSRTIKLLLLPAVD
ncbi:MAG: hypothetical protein HY827_02035 [Actinobacteria bacterium]|nr:hypothetical protein [Actinomycetota bacterium]